jgi:L-fuconolactonase
MTITIDAHQHFWQLSKPFNYGWLDNPQLAAIRRDFLPQDLKPHLTATGVERSIFVQTQHNVMENRWVLDMAREHLWIAGVVGWVDLTSPDCQRQIETFARDPKFVGVRHVVQDEPDDNFIVRDDVVNNLRVLGQHGLPFDLLFYVKLGRRLPDLRMVIDHLSKPQIKLGRMDNWLEPMRAAAECPNIYCKLSGIITEADWKNWKPADLKPYVQTALELFGPERCMYGSDWPVCELAGSYEQVHHALIEALGPISASERDMIFGGTAAKFYELRL